VGFEAGPEDSYGRRGSDKIRQTANPVVDVKSAVIKWLPDSGG